MKPGDEVECIKDYSPGWHRMNSRTWCVTPPIVGERYVVRDICRASKFPSILLAGVKNPTVRFHHTGRRGEASFLMSHFRVIEKRVTEASVVERFTKGADRKSEKWDNRRRVNA
jgi:hypothetical protein